MHRKDKYSQHSSIIWTVKWLSVCLRTNWLWIRVLLQSLKRECIRACEILKIGTSIQVYSVILKHLIQNETHQHYSENTRLVPATEKH